MADVKYNVINQRLSDWYKIDTKKHVGIKTFCSKPFDTILIDKTGSCFACECTAWLPQSVGNLHVSSLKEILNGNNIKILQNSIADNSYRYCNEHQCPFLLKDRPLGWSENLPVSNLKQIRLAVDDSCNLSCSSCRNKKIFYKSGKEFERRLLIIKKIITYLNENTDPVTVHIGSDGDPFASLIYRYFIKKTAHLKHCNFTIQTNGLLIKKMFQKNKELFKKIKVLGVSVDGATKNTYEKLRRGGKFDVILENLKFIKSIKNFQFHLHMVVQNDNWHEMPLMLELADTVNADKVFFNSIQDWNTQSNFEKQDYFSKKDFKNLYDTCKLHTKFRGWTLS